MTLNELYKNIEKELCNYCKVKRHEYDINSAAGRCTKRDQHHLPNPRMVPQFTFIELNALTADRHLEDLPDAEKYWSIEITFAKYISPGTTNIYYDYDMRIFVFLISKDTEKISIVRELYPGNGPASINDVYTCIKNMHLLKRDILDIYNWIKCLSVALI